MQATLHPLLGFLLFWIIERTPKSLRSIVVKNVSLICKICLVQTTMISDSPRDIITYHLNHGWVFEHGDFSCPNCSKSDNNPGTLGSRSA